MSYESHPAAEIFPLLVGAKYEAFKLDIQTHGLLTPIWLYEGKILDGRNRYRACIDVGLEPSFQTYTGNSPVAFAWSLNGVRRQLSKSQLALVAVKMLGPLKEEAKKRQEATRARPGERADERPTESGGAQETGAAVSQAAALVGVGKTIVQDAKAVVEQAPELVESIESGKLTVSKAAQINYRKQRAVVPDLAAGIRDLAHEGHRAAQIADQLQITEERVRKIARRESITLPDAALGNFYRIDAHRVVEETVTGLEGFALGLNVVEKKLSGITVSEAVEWSASMASSLKILSRLRAKLVEIAREQ